MRWNPLVRACIGLGLFLAFVCATTGGARAADSKAEGLKHARKANRLADLGNCKAALPEYDKALRSVVDPTLLFNRAECHRKMGQPEKAISDYKLFLVELPTAPNRAEVEEQIASLEKAIAAAAVPPPAEPPVAAHAPAHAAAAPPSPAPSPSLRLPPKSKHALPPDPATSGVAERKAEPKPESKVVFKAEAGELMMPEPETPATPPPAPAAKTPQPVLIDSGTALAPHADESKPSGHLWLWIAIGAAVVVGGAVATLLVLNQGTTDTSGGALGNYKF